MWPFSTTKKVRTRAAPSPTGFPHIGNLRTALFDYLLAKSQHGSFIVRIEDTDHKRSVEGATEKFLESLEWLGLSWDEGPNLKNGIIVGEKGAKGPYWQSRRLDIYTNHVNDLLARDKAYYCFCTPEILDAMRKVQIENKQITKYDGRCRLLPSETVSKMRETQQPSVIRLKVPTDEQLSFTDYLRGTIMVSTNEVEDQVLMKSDGYPTYHLASVVDDRHMNISHVLRGEEWIASTPKHVLLYTYFGWEPPIFVHVPLVLGTDKQKLSKRDGAFSVEDLKQAGYLPEAVLNYLVLLGWRKKHDDTELFSLDELVKQFSLEDLNKSPGIFDRKKLDWYNEQYLRKLSVEQLMSKVLPYMESAYTRGWDEAFLKRLVEVEQPRFKRLTDVVESARLFLTDTSYDSELLSWKDVTREEIREHLNAVSEIFASIEDSDWTITNLETVIKKYIEQKQVPNGNVLWPLRVALSGKKQSPSPFECAYILLKKQAISRIATALQKLNA